MGFGFRNGWRKGRFLIIDSESGMTRYSDQVKKDYTGEMVTKRWADYEQPQDFVRPSSDPFPIPFANPGVQNFDVDTCLPEFVGETNIPTPFGPANHLYECTQPLPEELLITDSGLYITTDSGLSIITG